MRKKFPSVIISLLLSLCFTVSAAGNSYTVGTDVSVSGSPVISAPAAVLMDAKSGAIIYSKDMSSAYYPASITKIMTALLAIENSNNNFDQRVTFSSNAVNSVPLGDSYIAMHEDESLSLEECLMGLMLASANEVANALGEHFATTTEDFAVLMNKRAAELGAVNTHFANPNGSHNEDHYTTALDMAYIMREAVKQPKFIEVISTKSLKLPPTLKQPEERPLNNSHKMIQPNHTYYQDYIVGGKTGFTDQAGNTLVTYAEKDGMALIAVILNNVSSVASYEDTQTLFEYGFGMYKDMSIFNAAEFREKINIIESKENETIDLGIVNIYAKDSVTLHLPSSISFSDIKKELDMPYQLEPPVQKDQKVGSLKLVYMGNELATVDLFAEESFVPVAVEAAESRALNSSDGMNVIVKLVLAIIGVLFAAFVIYIFAERRRRKKRREMARARRESLANKRPSKVTSPTNYKYKSNNIRRQF